MTLRKVAEFDGEMLLRWSPDGRYLATGDGRKTDGIPLWGRASGEVRVLTGDAAGLNWSADGQRLASTVDTTTRIWDAASGAIVCTITHAPASLPAFWSPDGRHVLIGMSGGIDVWDAAEGALRHTLDGASYRTWLLRWSPSDHVLATGFTGTLKIWKPATGEIRHVLASPDPDTLGWSPDGRYLHTDGKGGARIWDADSGALLRKFGGLWRGVDGAQWARQGHLLAVPGKRSTLIWDPGTGTLIREIPDTARYPHWSRDGRLLALGGHPVRVWEVETGTVVRSFDGTIPYGPMWSPDERQVATLMTGTVSVWDMESGELLHGIGGVRETLYSVQWSADSRHIVAQTRDLHRDPERTVRTRTKTHPTTGVMAHVHSGDIEVEMSPDGRHFATAASSRVAIWSFD